MFQIFVRELYQRYGVVTDDADSKAALEGHKKTKEREERKQRAHHRNEVEQNEAAEVSAAKSEKKLKRSANANSRIREIVNKLKNARKYRETK